MNTSQPQLKSRNSKGLALVIVVSMLALLTVLTIAIFSLAENERAASDQHGQQEMARGIADTGINLVMSQIWQATKQDATTPGREIWASQPGAIRKYRADGAFHSGFKLYSSSSMVVAGNEEQMINDVAPGDWNLMPARYVDLNDPVVRPPVAGTSEPMVYFPIIDPRAYVRDRDLPSTAPDNPENPNVEGFWYTSTSRTNSEIFGVKMAQTPDDISARLAMPVEWVYLLKDGTVGALDQTNAFVKPDGSLLTAGEAATNPIVGRIAFWADDESTKLNVNVASEPSYWTTPSFYHDRDMWWAHYQPTTYEYQRYPGHPATIALSTVFFPNREMDLYGKDVGSQSYQEILERKESIYLMAPKVNTGGSKAGTIPYWKFVDNYAGYQDAMYKKWVDLTDSIKERLYASVDELYFAQKMGTGNLRDVNSFVDSSGKPTKNWMFTKPTEKYSADKINLERARFFLTAQSRMPEVNIFGTPRVAIWPIADEGGIEYEPGKKTGGAKGSDYRTGYDQLIAFCASMGKPTTSGQGEKSYFFRRKCAYSPTVDVNLYRNQRLMAYLRNLLQQQLPGGLSFAQKYPNDYEQILVEIFDYIRMTNLYDGFLAPTKEELQKANTVYDFNNGNRYPTGTNEIDNHGSLYRNRPTTFKTYTYDRGSSSQSRGGSLDPKTERMVENTFPGHGMVVPSEYNGKKGFGRFVTLTEVGFQFICTADGQTDKGSWTNLEPVPGETLPNGEQKYRKGTVNIVRSGGRTALWTKRDTQDRIGPGDQLPNDDQDKLLFPFTGETGQRQFWYSNYPPVPIPAVMQAYYKVDSTKGTKDPNSPYNHPGCKPEYWNATLDRGLPPLTATERRVQGIFLMEFAMIAAGYAELNPEFTVVIEGLKNTKLNGKDLYDTSSVFPITWKSDNDVYHRTDCRPVGGCISAAAMSVGRRAAVHGEALIPADPGYDINASSSGDPHRGTKNMDLVTKYVTINIGAGETMRFTGAPLTIKLYSSHKTTQDNLVQTYNINLPSQDLPAPQIVTMSADRSWQQSGNTVTINDAVDAPHWWAFNYAGAINRYVGGWTPRGYNVAPGSNGFVVSTRGRFFNQGGNDRSSAHGIPRGASLMWAFEPVSGGAFTQNLLNPSDPADDVTTDNFSDTKWSDTEPLTSKRGSRGQDTVFTMVPKHGDTRLLAAMPVVPATEWMDHPRIGDLGKVVKASGHTVAFKQYVAHSMSRYYSSSDAGFDRGSASLRLVPNANYNARAYPEIAAHKTAVEAAGKYGDFDTGGFASGCRDGALINKPDEGDTSITFRRYGPNDTQTIRMVNAYLATIDYSWLYTNAGESFMTPNRIMPSPGMFGSLSTGVYDGVPWKTLLFRPQTRGSLATQYLNDHPGAAKWQGGKDPADHYIMDLFWMPIVEPYAVSEPFSTAGKVNINYQIVPFSHIRRATGIHAVLKGEMLKAVPVADAGSYNVMPGSPPDRKRDEYTYRQPWTDLTKNQASNTTIKRWHRQIDVETRQTSTNPVVLGTISQFESRFNFSPRSGDKDDATPPPALCGLFRSASQICEIHLLPKVITGGDGADSIGSDKSYTVAKMSSVFWATRRLTGDNIRERPYANIYGKITTQSNTYRVHFRAQALKKARSTKQNVFEPAQDAVLTDYRGSALVERRIDPSDTRIPDYGAAANPINLPPLDDFYRFRVLEMKRFMP
ncbi:uncharacterized protein (TIGR02600 family) [Roseimicrobium gellanilyticum]|uniref:Uncharacterized protein (TIGR02600 family) n=1 Tax=Roseimicrobium gellanilyticum TaxID=748857 RepID=A0A366HTS4_9BACT|nr:Verru_Chthon cassette protein A [Roseimicrobium gellanilyticum]RBP47686.1 uncharacterized protein (TIGR02600 family) [Roseimicrobium gellanilyticum]